MSKEKQIVEEMKKDLCECHTIDEWAAREYGEAYTDFDATAEKMLDRGWIKQSDLTPCDVCIFNPPSSYYGKPCTVCPAQAKGGAE